MNIFKALLHKTGGDSAKRSITWYCGDAWEPWSPKNLERGMAGSQGAVISLSREWAAAGHKVTVYNRCEGLEGVYDGVAYVDYTKFDRNANYDIFIVWRERNLKVLNEPIIANKVLLELQDAPIRKALFTQELIKRVDIIVVKSRSHLKEFDTPLLNYIAKRKFRIIPNGVERRFLELKKEKDPYKLIYASNYYRGLELMLRYGWPIIKKEVPAAQLHIYYGWEHFDSFQHDRERRSRWKKEMIDLINKAGVIDHGRVGLTKLMEEKASAVIHYYGCVWAETDCVSVRESALVGCVPVTTKSAVLAEKPYCVRVSGNPADKRTQEKAAYKIVQLLRHQKKLQRIAEKYRGLAARETWSAIAKLWVKRF